MDGKKILEYMEYKRQQRHGLETLLNIAQEMSIHSEKKDIKCE